MFKVESLEMKKSATTSFIHDGASMTKYENEPIIIGDYNHNRVEFMHLSHEKWYIAKPYPFQQRLFGYGAVSKPGKVFILGGCCEDEWSLISLFQSHGWSKVGNLNQGRMNFLVITYQTDVMVIGGISHDQMP